MAMVQANRFHTIKGLNAQFENIYRLRKRSVDARMNNVVQRWTSNNAFEQYGLFSAVPMPRRWDRGQSRLRQGFVEYLMEVENLAFELTIQWHRYDEEDDQTQTLRSRVNEGAARFAYLEEALFVELITGTASELSYIPNAWDGYPLFSNGGGTRMGLSGGNIWTGTTGSNSTPLDFLEDLNGVISAFIAMRDTENQPLHVGDEMEQPMVIVSPALRQNAMKAQGQTLMAVRSGAAGGMESNVFKGSFDIWVNPRLSGYDWYTILQRAPNKPVGIQVRQPVRNNLFTEQNSHDLADNNLREIVWDERLMIFPYDIHSAFKTDN